ncbi:hypothetical protein ACFVS2_25395 [Brevibacillus sp. NPDC058079]|uniref:hypothetical protein n=1 Tax=Brevibacillus sp. NPDC058079 TaxID=3346330 RepID=UPI0036E3322F
MTENTWGLQIVKVNVEEGGFDTLIALNIGNEAKTRDMFNQIKNEFTKNNGEPDCVLDLLDDEDSIVDDWAITKKQAVEIASRLGHNID